MMKDVENLQTTDEMQLHLKWTQLGIRGWTGVRDNIMARRDK